MGTQFLQPISTQTHNTRSLRRDLADARRHLRDAEAELAAEQATVNAFRMQCRLKLGEWVDRVLELRAQKQALLTQTELARQAAEDGVPFDDAHPFGDDGLDEGDDSAELPPPPNVDISEWTGSARDRAAEKRLYRQLARRFHPDLASTSAERAYTTSIMAAVNNAYARRDIQTLRDLAGELDPATVAALSGGATRDIRRLRRAILDCKRRERKARYQLQQLRQENTARLCRRAQRLEADGLAWWNEVRDQLNQDIGRYETDIEHLRQLAT